MGESDAESLVAGRRARGGLRGTGAGAGLRRRARRSRGRRGRCRSRPACGACGRNGGLETMADIGRRATAARLRGAAGRVEHRAGVGRAGRRRGRRATTRSRSRAAGRGSPSGRPAPRGCRTATCSSSSAASRRSARGSSAWRGRASTATGPLAPREIARFEAPAHARQLRGGRGAARRLRPDARLPALRRQRLREDARLEAAGPAAHAAAALRPRGLRAQPASAIGAPSPASARRSRPRRFIFSCRVVGRTPSARAARRWLPLGGPQGVLDDVPLVGLDQVLQGRSRPHRTQLAPSKPPREAGPAGPVAAAPSPLCRKRRSQAPKGFTESRRKSGVALADHDDDHARHASTTSGRAPPSCPSPSSSGSRRSCSTTPAPACR